MTATPSACCAREGGAARCTDSAAVTNLFAHALFWLVAATLLGVIAAFKLVAPGFLGDCPWLTYGKVVPAAANAFLYGFALQAGLGFAAWLIARDAKNGLCLSWLVMVASFAWNFGVLVGTLGIFGGGSTGFAGLEFPRASAAILFCAFVAIGLGLLLTLRDRRERTLGIAHWYLLAAMFVFAWIELASVAQLLCAPVHGVLQAVIQGWFMANLTHLVLGGFALAALFHFVGEGVGRPVHSRPVALFGFWTLVLFGGWSGLLRGGPFPAWLASLSQAAGTLLVVPVAAVVWNILQTVRADAGQIRARPALRFLILAMCAYAVAAFLQFINACPIIARVTDFTTFNAGITQILLHGFIALVLLAAIHEIFPRLAAQSWPSPKLAGAQLWLWFSGAMVMAVNLVIGGLRHGFFLADPSRAYLDYFRADIVSRLFFAGGALLLLAGAGAMAMNFLWLLARCCKSCCAATEPTAPLKAQSAGAAP
jgi:cytochrome c oxidase cbb3-type subunit 1